MSETLGLILVRANKITRSQLYDALREQRASGARLGDILFRRGWIGEDDLAMLVAKQLDIPFVDSSTLEKIPFNLTEKFPAHIATDFHVVPVRLIKGKLTVAMDDQKTRNYLDEISYLSGMTCIPAMGAPSAIRATVKRLYGRDLKAAPAPLATAARPRKPSPTDGARGPAVKTLEALPVKSVDAQGRDVVSAKNVKGEDVVYLLTDVSPPTPQEPIQPSFLEPDPDAHDNFLAPEAANDDRPMWRPKGTRAAKPEPAPEPARSAVPPRSSADFDIVRAAERLFEATDAVGVAQVIVSFARHLMDRAILFDVSDPRYAALARASAVPEGEEDRTEFSAPAEELILLGIIAQTRQPSYGPTPDGDMYDRFFDSVGFMKPPFILLYPLVIGGRTRAVLFGGLGVMRPPEEFGDLQLLFKEAATALEILAG